jgi:tetratricopeptide (TPR) repeat protein
LTQLKKYDEALVSLDRVHELRPDSVIPLLQMAQIHGLQENLPAAIHELNRAHSMDPQNVVVLLARAEAYRENGQQEKALADVDAALKLSPHLPRAMSVRASLLADAGRHDEAITELEALRQQEPGDLLALLQLGMLYAAEEMYDRTVEVFSAVLAQRPNALIALRGRGDALLNLGRHQQAIADYEALMKAEPDDPGTLNNLAWVLATSPYGRLRNGKRAVALATQACELTDYQAAYILSTLAAAYAETGDFQAAVQWIEKGLEVAEEELTEPLKEELQSYRDHLPWRELLTAQSQDHSPP